MIEKLKGILSKERLKKILLFFANPRLLFCVGIAWMITNGWSYIMLGVGVFWDIPWMSAVAVAYLTFLWLPISPEKIVTVALAILFLRLWFPKDKQTLAVLQSAYKKMKESLVGQRQKKKEKRAARKKRRIDAGGMSENKSDQEIEIE
jgi:hypothetical protein